MRYLYNIIYYLAIPFIVIRLLIRSRKALAYRKRIGERFACFKTPDKPIDIWVHAVSFGETIAITPLIKSLQLQYPELHIAITTMTPTGSARVIKAFADNVFHVYVPYDAPLFVKRFLHKTRPKLAVMVETELWPNILHYCNKRRIPIMLANARLSDRSAQKYRLIQRIMRKMLGHVSILAVQTQAEANRFIDLGMKPDRVKVTGSIKFDINLPNDIENKSIALRKMLGSTRHIWIAASTHEGEEEQILNAFAKIKNVISDVLLVLVPRHPERFAKIANLCKKQDYQVVLRSECKACSQQTDIFIGDTMGELLLFYAAADVAFVGGSLVKVGGHNLLEPAALGIVAIMGPHTHNFKEISQQLLANNGVKQIHNSNELADTVIDLLHNSDKRIKVGNNAKRFVEKNRGSLEKHLQIIKTLLS